MTLEKIKDHLRAYSIEVPEGFKSENQSEASLLPNVLGEELTTAEILEDCRQSAEAVLRQAGVEDDPTKEPLDRDGVSPASRTYWALLILKRARYLELTSEGFAGLGSPAPDPHELPLGAPWSEWQEALVRSAFLLGRTAGLLEEHTYVPEGANRPLAVIGLEGQRVWARSSGGGASPRELTVRWMAIMHDVVVRESQNDPSVSNKELARLVLGELEAAKPPAVVGYSTILKEIRKFRHRQRTAGQSHETRRGTKKDEKPSKFAHRRPD